MTDLWFLFLVIVLAKPVTDGGPERTGDVIKAQTMGASETQADCDAAGEALAAVLERVGEGSVIVFHHCVLMPATVADEQGFVNE